MPYLGDTVKEGIMAQSYPLFSFKTIDSTQSEIKRMLRVYGTLDDFTTVVAEGQESGRGRGVSVWQDEPGKCALMSVYVNWEHPVQKSFDVNRWVCHCLGALLPSVVEFKWPNDLMVGYRKLAGLLIENHWAGGVIRSSTIGLGMNLKPLEYGPRRAISLEEIGMDITPEEVVSEVVGSFRSQKPAIENGALLERRYTKLLWGKEDHRMYEDPSGELIEGRVVGVNDTGQLLLELAQTKNVQAYDLDAIKWKNPLLDE